MIDMAQIGRNCSPGDFTPLPLLATLAGIYTCISNVNSKAREKFSKKIELSKN
jgi:hypothetical protein